MVPKENGRRGSVPETSHVFSTIAGTWSLSGHQKRRPMNEAPNEHRPFMMTRDANLLPSVHCLLFVED